MVTLVTISVPCNATPGFCSRDRDQAWLTQPLLHHEALVGKLMFSTSQQRSLFQSCLRKNCLQSTPLLFWGAFIHHPGGRLFIHTFCIFKCSLKNQLFLNITFKNADGLSGFLEIIAYERNNCYRLLSTYKVLDLVHSLHAFSLTAMYLPGLLWSLPQFSRRGAWGRRSALIHPKTHLVEMGFRFYLNGREICLQSEDLNFLGSCTLFSQRRNILAAWSNNHQECMRGVCIFEAKP